MRKLIAATIVFLSLFVSTYSHASVADEIHYLSMAIYYEAEGENMKGSCGGCHHQPHEAS